MHVLTRAVLPVLVPRAEQPGLLALWEAHPALRRLT